MQWINARILSYQHATTTCCFLNKILEILKFKSRFSHEILHTAQEMEVWRNKLKVWALRE